MNMNFEAGELFKKASSLLVVLGVLLLLVAAVGGLPIGGQSTSVMDLVWRYILAGCGGILLVVGIILILRESKLIFAAKDGKEQESTAVKVFDSGRDRLQYTLKRMKEAQNGVYDLSWEKPLKIRVDFSDDDIRDYLHSIQEVSRKVTYRHIVMFCGHWGRVALERKLLSSAGSHYELAGYADLPEDGPPRRHFVVIDDKEVILRDLAVRQPEIVKYFRDYYDALWAAATPIKVGPEENLELLKEAERQLGEADVRAVQQWLECI